MIKIILCTTFRDFKGTDNDKIQYMFLDSIKKQTYQNFLLVTTTFGEKNVKRVVDSYLGDKSVTREVKLPAEYRFSLTEVVLGVIPLVKSIIGNSVVVWCTCDILLPSNFFQLLVENYKPDFAGIVHPNILYRTIDDLNFNNNPIIHIGGGIDLLFFDGRIIVDSKQDISRYRFYDWGFFEHFMAGIAFLHAKHKINLYCKTQVLKVKNDRAVCDESEAYFKRCFDMNGPVVAKFYKDKGLSSRLYSRGNLFDIHCQFKMLNPTSDYTKMRNDFSKDRILSLIKMESKSFVKLLLSETNALVNHLDTFYKKLKSFTPL